MFCEDPLELSVEGWADVLVDREVTREPDLNILNGSFMRAAITR